MNHDFQEQLLKALAPLGRGVGADGRPLNAAVIGTKAAARGRAFTERIVKGEAKAARKLGNRRFRG